MWQDTDVSENLAAYIFAVRALQESEDGDRNVLRNVGILPHRYTVSQPKVLDLEILVVFSVVE
jgi:hypothetical protein